MSAGPLIIIGGHEDREDDCIILKEIVKHTNRHTGRLLLMTVATQLPDAVAKDYLPLFQQLGIREIDVLDIRTREDAKDPDNVGLLERASTVFFTGGDQLRITSQVGDSPIYQTLMKLHERGSLIVGTSAGAAAMSETMIVAGESDASPTTLGPEMAPGLNLMKGVVIDSHFAERGRLGRLLGAVALNPRNIGIGIDEDTAIWVEEDTVFRVLGSGAVYVVDGSTVSYSNLSEKVRDGTLSVMDVKLHMLAEGDRFDLRERCPSPKQVAKESDTNEQKP